jgi:hypothetical protein
MGAKHINKLNSKEIAKYLVEASKIEEEAFKILKTI